MSPRSRRLLVRAAVLSGCAVCACVVAATEPPLVWRGDITTARGVVTDVAHAWQQSGHPKITLQPFNTVSGIDAVADGTADIAGSARAAAPSRGNEASLTFTPVAWDALVMVAHPDNPVHNLSLRQLHDIYFGKITNWSEVGGRNEPIDLYAVASPSDGVEFSLRRLLYGRGNQPVAAPRLYVNVAKLEEAVALDPKALGVSTLAGVRNNRKLQILAIDHVKPGAATVASGRYPLYTPLYLVTSSSNPQAAQAQQFVQFMSSPKAKAVMRAHDLLPYADGASLAAGASQRMASIAAEVGRSPSSTTPIAAPGATYASRVAIAPTSQRTAEARAQMLARRDAAAAPADQALNAPAASTADASRTGNATKSADTAAPLAPAAKPKVSFAAVQGSARSSARPGFGTVSGGVLGASGNAADGGSPYRVVSGDTLSSIARGHEVSVDELRRWNDLEGSELRVGQRLRVRAR